MGSVSITSIAAVHRARIFRWCLAAGALGIAFGLWFSVVLNPFVVYIVFLGAVSGVVLALKQRSMCVILLLASFLLFGLYRSVSAQEQFADNQPKSVVSYYRPHDEAKSAGSGSLSAITRLRTHILESISDNLPHIHAQLLGGILVGARQTFPDTLRESFNKIGITHIVAVSGYNITILIVILYALCGRFGIKRSRSIIIVAVGIVCFTLLAGASAATVRAALMGGVVVVARFLGRGARSHTAILIALCAMLYFDPLVLTNIGFQLSFSAMLGLMYIGPLLERFASGMPAVFGLKDTLIQTLAAIAATGPLILWYFGTISLIAPFANLIVVPLVPFIMATGATVAGISMAASMLGAPFFTILAPILWALPWAPLEYVLRASSLLSHMPLASVTIQHPLMIYALVVFFYAFLSVVLIASSRRQAECALT